MFAIKHILVPTDFSDTSEHALVAAIEIARMFQARLTLPVLTIRDPLEANKG